MKYICHRGCWHRQEQKPNSISALEKALEIDCGVETDIRDHNGELVIAHDPPSGSSPELEQFFKLYSERGSNKTIALNIKSDGLSYRLRLLLDKYSIANYFVFDMSTPETIRYAREKVRFATRISDMEPVPVLYKEANTVWLDTLDKEWLTDRAIERHLAADKIVAIVSPELHNREPAQLWKQLKTADFVHHQNLYLCTDFPLDAKDYFHETH